MTFIGGALSAAGLAAAAQAHYPTSAEIAAGQSGKMGAFVQTWGVASFLGGGVAFLGGAQCMTYNDRVVQGLEEEGRRRGFGPPQPPVVGEREWLQRKAFLEGNADFGRYITIAGSVLMGAGGLLMEQYDAPPDRSSASRLGPGIGVFLIGYATTIAGVALWSSSTRDAQQARRPAAGEDGRRPDRAARSGHAGPRRDRVLNQIASWRCNAGDDVFTCTVGRSPRASREASHETCCRHRPYRLSTRRDLGLCAGIADAAGAFTSPPDRRGAQGTGARRESARRHRAGGALRGHHIVDAGGTETP